MTAKTTTATDVLLCYAVEDRRFGEMVEQGLADAGLTVFKPWTGMAPDEAGHDRAWDALVESVAVVGVVRSDGVVPPALLVAIGAAKMRDKPVYVVTDTIGPLDVPRIVAALPTFPVSRLGDVVDAVRRNASPLTVRQRAALTTIYGRHRTSLRQMLTSDGSIRRLGSEFRDAAGGEGVSGERLARELMRLRRRVGSRRRPAERRRRGAGAAA